MKMGFRTVVILNNDLASEWGNDPSLGKKILHSAGRINVCYDNEFQGGVVVECCHMDNQSFAIIDGMRFESVSHSSWSRSDTKESVALRLLKSAADKLGFRLVKKSKGI
jgi:hypothetical protein